MLRFLTSYSRFLFPFRLKIKITATVAMAPTEAVETIITISVGNPPVIII